MNLKEQQYICTIAECGNITRAAERLFITQPALSLYINNLEKILGFKLFDRVDKQFLLTAAGELYVEKAQKMLELQSEFENGLYNLRHNITGQLIVGVQLRRAPLLLPPVIADFQKLYPNIKIFIKEGVKADLENFLNNNQIHLLIYDAQEPREGLLSTRLYKDKPLLAVHKENPLNKKAEEREGERYPFLDLRCCRNERFILPTKRQSLRSYVDGVFTDMKFHTGNYIELRNFETIIGLVNVGFGLGFSREQYRQSMLHFTDVNYYLFSNKKDGTNYVYAGCRKNRDHPEYVEGFIRLLAERGKKIENNSYN